MSRRLPLYKTSRVLYDRVTHEREVSVMDAITALLVLFRGPIERGLEE